MHRGNATGKGSSTLSGLDRVMITAEGQAALDSAAVAHVSRVLQAVPLEWCSDVAVIVSARCVQPNAGGTSDGGSKGTPNDGGR